MKDIINIIKDGNLVIPMYLLRNYKKFDLKMDEFIFLMYLYNIGNKSIFDTSKYSNDSNIFSDIEKEFGRTLSSIEYEIVKAWLDNNISEELIKLALKEAIYNGVFNLRYIDKILYEWSKKGIKNSKDVEKAKKNYKNNKKDIDLELVDWNWFDEE